MENISSDKFYMDIQLDFGEKYGNPGIEMDVNKFKYAITFALKSLYGDMGYIIPIDILKYREDDRRAYIRIPSSDVVKVWSSLSLLSRYDGQECAFKVYKVTPVLSCLNLNSNQYQHQIAEDCPDAMES